VVSLPPAPRHNFYEGGVETGVTRIQVGDAVCAINKVIFCDQRCSRWLFAEAASESVEEECVKKRYDNW
jgi:hypothetical protein